MTAAEYAATAFANRLAQNHVARHGKRSLSAGEVADNITERLADRGSYDALSFAELSDIAYEAAYAAGLNS